MTPKPEETTEKEVPAVPADTNDTTTDEAAEGITDPDTTGETETGEADASEADASESEDSEDAEAGEDGEAGGAEAGEEAGEDSGAEAKTPRRRGIFAKVVAFALLPALALLFAAAAAYLKWEDATARGAEIARMESVQAARDGAITMLSYQPETVDQDLGAARDLLTGDFRDDYTNLVNDVVIPGAKEKQISAVATVPAVASISADANHAEVLVFVNQTVVIGGGAPTATASSVKVTLDKDGDRWLISGFDPV